MVLISISLMLSDVDVSVSHLYVFFGEISVHVIFPFHDWIVFGVLSLISSSYLNTSHSSDISFANIFSHSVCCLLVLLTISFAVLKLLILMKSQ